MQKLYIHVMCLLLSVTPLSTSRRNLLAMRRCRSEGRSKGSLSPMGASRSTERVFLSVTGIVHLLHTRWERGKALFAFLCAVVNVMFMGGIEGSDFFR